MFKFISSVCCVWQQILSTQWETELGLMRIGMISSKIQRLAFMFSNAFSEATGGAGCPLPSYALLP